MKRKSTSLFAASVLLLLLASATAAQTQYTELPNFYQINENLYRGAQPKSGGIEKLVELGIKTIINLRDDDERALSEGREAQAAGLRYFNVPLARQARPTDAQVEQVLSLINAAENQPVFIHCKRGSDRTGTIIAVYRIEHDGWMEEEAREEAERHGMFWWKIQMKSYIRGYVRRSKEATLTTAENRP
ncbi:MAG: tyrosine-protein phosphatase [Pyrinomonadaceae bacterium]|nr:tyrosine-protein phosphatase [Pyrinomonadaceae bacterium]